MKLFLLFVAWQEQTIEVSPIIRTTEIYQPVWITTLHIPGSKFEIFRFFSCNAANWLPCMESYGRSFCVATSFCFGPRHKYRMAGLVLVSFTLVAIPVTRLQRNRTTGDDVSKKLWRYNFRAMSTHMHVRHRAILLTTSAYAVNPRKISSLWSMSVPALTLYICNYL